MQVYVAHGIYEGHSALIGVYLTEEEAQKNANYCLDTFDYSEVWVSDFSIQTDLDLAFVGNEWFHTFERVFPRKVEMVYDFATNSFEYPPEDFNPLDEENMDKRLLNVMLVD